MPSQPSVRKKNAVKETVQITVIVATHNQANDLKRFLDAMTELPEDPEWELIVVNCSCTDDTGRLLTEQLQTSDMQLNVITSGSKSLSHARNMALKYAKGNLIVFTDDNVILDMFSLHKLQEASQQYPKAKMFGARVFLDTSKLPSWINKSVGLRKLLAKEHDRGNKYQSYKINEYPSGACVAIRRSLIIDELTPWPALIGPGTKQPLGEDIAFMTLLSGPDVKNRVYVPDATATKRVDNDNLTKSFMTAYGYGKVLGQLSKIFKIPSAKVKATSPMRECTGFTGIRYRIHQSIGIKIGRFTFRNRHQLWPL